MSTLLSSERVSQRLVSLDVFRGFTMAAMVLVNNGGDGDHVYTQLAHSYWNGCTFTDWIFPFFLWISGMSTTYAMAARRSRGATDGSLALQVLKRSALIFLVGVLLNGFPFGLFGASGFSLATWRIPGVLQRIAICYLVGSLLYLVMPSRKYWMVILGLFVAYWALMEWVPVPGTGAGLWERGRNFAAYVDQMVIGSHAYARTRPWDPEGIISTLPAIASFLFGIITGDYLRLSKASNEEKTSWFFLSGCVLLLASVILDMWIPINKRLWTPSYVLMTTGWAHLVFACSFFLIDVRGYKRRLTPFLVFGMNAIFIYAVSSMLESLLGAVTIAGTSPSGEATVLSLQAFLMHAVFFPLFASPYNASLAYAVAVVLLMYLMGYLMWRKKWFVKI
jgi:predicted acyltransferase